MKRRHLARIDRRAATEMARAVRFRRSSRPRTAKGRTLLSDHGSMELTVDRTVEPVIDDRKGRWMWHVRAYMGRPSCSVYSEGSRWNPAPLTYQGISEDGFMADADARQVEALVRSHHARIVLTPEPMEVSTRG